MLANDVRLILETLDVEGARRLWAAINPHLPQDGTDQDILASLHRARTQAESLHISHRAYSHRWLEERGFPSGLPDHLKPSADRLYPRVVSAVGIAVKPSKLEFAPAALEIRGAMEMAVYEADADGKLTDSAHVRGRMKQARAKARKALFGIRD